MSRPDGQIKINATPQLKYWFKDRAAANKRSLNSEVLYHLEAIKTKEENRKQKAKMVKPQRLVHAEASGTAKVKEQPLRLL